MLSWVGENGKHCHLRLRESRQHLSGGAGFECNVKG